jgi:exosome complex component RRP45
MVVDPNLREETVMDGRMTITLNSHKEVCAMQKAGGTPIALGTLLECTKIASGKVAELTQVLQQALKASEKKLVQP